jgi:predicted ATP-dependent serine protease
MTRLGLQPVLDPTAFLERRVRGADTGAACATAVAMEANRPVLVEVQVGFKTWTEFAQRVNDNSSGHCLTHPTLN